MDGAVRLRTVGRQEVIGEKRVNVSVTIGVLIPFIGTSFGAAFVFFMKRQLGRSVQRALTGFAAGVMTAASVWSLLIPAIEQSSSMGVFAFVPAFVGFWIGTLFLLVLDKTAVTLHNIPEGMAVGVMYAGLLSGSTDISAGGALALALGIAIQNVPEGAIISMPLHAEGKSKPVAFLGGVLSGAVEPVGALITILVSGLLVPVMPYLLSFAAGAMIYVVVEELIPEMSEGEHSNVGVLMFALGFTVMMILDITLG